MIETRGRKSYEVESDYFSEFLIKGAENIITKEVKKSFLAGDITLANILRRINNERRFKYLIQKHK
jgi:hypothetical protein